jgi:hypothetical protein
MLPAKSLHSPAQHGVEFNGYPIRIAGGACHYYHHQDDIMMAWYSIVI